MSLLIFVHPFYLVIADRTLARAEEAVARVKDPRFSAAMVNAAELEDIRELIRKADPDVVINAVDPRFVMPIFLACEIENTNYIDMAMSLSRKHPHYPYTETGVKLGDEQFARDYNWDERKIFALIGMGVEPGMSDVFAKYASEHLFSRIDSCTILDGSNLRVEGFDFVFDRFDLDINLPFHLVTHSIINHLVLLPKYNIILYTICISEFHLFSSFEIVLRIG